jgi:hypothetical protein
MGKRFLHSQPLPTRDFPAGTIGPLDLPVNPLSLVLLGFNVTNTAPAALETYSAIDDVLNNITSVVIKHKGENIISGTLRDLAVVNALTGRKFPWASGFNKTDNYERRIVVPLGFGRKAYDEAECFPATSRGNLTLELTRAANPASFDDMNLIVETVELLEADPARYLKYTPQATTAVVGQFEQPLPIGNPYARLVFFDTALSTLFTTVSSWGHVKLLKDNVEQYYPLSDSVHLAGMLGMQQKGWGIGPGHVHQFNGAAAGLDDTDDAENIASHGLLGYFQMDFDPNMDDMWLMETAGAADLKIRAIGTSATAVRVTPVEVVTVRK